MHIKQIVITGFKTYRDQVIIGPLSSKDNIVVGLNGHGKSNFFSAIMFVLSDKFSNIRQEEKRRLLHEGAGEPVTSATVEIVLDNTDGRLPIDKQTVTIRRTLKDTKDEYMIDNKHVTKNEINNLLESAGFSRANPYYVIQQGRISSLAAMNENQTLELLKEVAGTRVYDERKAESAKLLEESHRRREKLNEVMQRIQDRITELEAESSELRAYQNVEKNRRALQYALYKMHVLEAQGNIESIEEQKKVVADEMNTLKLNYHQILDMIETCESNYQQSKNDLGRIKNSFKRKEEERSSLDNRRTHLQSQI